MALSVFLSRTEGDESDPYEAIPILFNFHSILMGHYSPTWKRKGRSGARRKTIRPKL